MRYEQLPDGEYQHNFPIEGLSVAEGGRAINDEAVEALAESISRLGLLKPLIILEHPPSIEDGEWRHEVIAGRHRLRALRRLGIAEASVIIRRRLSPDQVRMIEISENLHRAELIKLERDEQVAEWIRLAAQQPTQSVSSDALPHGAIKEGAEKLGIGETDARRAVQVDGLSTEAKEVAKRLGLDRNRSALLEAAKNADPEDQVRALQDFLAAKAERARTREEAKVQAPRPVASGGTEMSDAEARRLAAEELDGWWTTWGDEPFAVDVVESLLVRVRARDS